MKTWQEKERSMTACDKAFMDSFKSTHDQYQISDKDIVEFLTGDSQGYFDGYTQLADAQNLWADAIVYARRTT